MGKTRPASNPWLTIFHKPSGWTWKVLKAYSADPDAKYARWFCDVSSPFTAPSSDLGDTYISDIYGTIIQIDPTIPLSALPVLLRDMIKAA